MFTQFVWNVKDEAEVRRLLRTVGAEEASSLVAVRSLYELKWTQLHVDTGNLWNFCKNKDTASYNNNLS